MEQEKAVRRALARSRLYGFLSPLYLYPDEETFSGLNWEEAREALILLGNRHGLKEPFESVRACFENASVLQSQYVTIFGHTLGQECPPYETQYGGAHIFQQAHDLGDIAGFYRAFGLEVSDQAKERLDHIAIQLEFMAFLAYKEAYALSTDGREKAEICRQAQRKFLADHLGRWVPFFTKRLEAEAKDDFYGRLAVLTERFLAFEVGGFGVKPFRVEGLAPIPFEPDGSCVSCGIQDLCFPREASS